MRCEGGIIIALFFYNLRDNITKRIGVINEKLSLAKFLTKCLSRIDQLIDIGDISLVSRYVTAKSHLHV